MSRLTILVVDDDRLLWCALRRMFAAAGFEARWAASIAEARGHLEADAFDAILIDYYMQHECGFDVLPLARARNPDAQILAHSALPSWEMAVQARRLGVKDAYYTYDWLGRVTCDSAASGACPTTTSDTNLKTSMTSTPPFTASGERKVMVHKPYTALSWTTTLVSGKDQLDTVGGVDMAWDGRGNRTYDDDIYVPGDRRDYTYDARNNLVTVSGKLYIDSVTLHDYTLTSAYDQKNRRFFKSVVDETTGVEAQWFFYYDPLDRLSEVKHTPNIASASTYTLFQFLWIGQRPLGLWQVNYPAATSSKRYIHADELGRPIEMWNWTTTTTRLWYINPDLFGWDTGTSGYYQPLSFPGQHKDPETRSYYVDDYDELIASRPELADNRYRVYDAFSGTYLQAAAQAERAWDPYGYAGNSPGESSTQAFSEGDVTPEFLDREFEMVNPDPPLINNCYKRPTPAKADGCLTVEHYEAFVARGTATECFNGPPTSSPAAWFLSPALGVTGAVPGYCKTIPLTTIVEISCTPFCSPEHVGSYCCYPISGDVEIGFEVAVRIATAYRNYLDPLQAVPGTRKLEDELYECNCDACDNGFGCNTSLTDRPWGHPDVIQ